MSEWKKAKCLKCGYSWDSQAKKPKCPSCGSIKTELEKIEIPEYKRPSKKIIKDIEKMAKIEKKEIIEKKEVENVEKIEKKEIIEKKEVENVEKIENMENMEIVENKTEIQEEEKVFICSECKAKLKKNQEYCFECGEKIMWEI
jgi:rubrerythrin